jgi:hypothetical protein
LILKKLNQYTLSTKFPNPLYVKLPNRLCEAVLLRITNFLLKDNISITDYLSSIYENHDFKIIKIYWNNDW